MILIALLIFAVILGLLIFVHELGHFMMAKKSGMDVEEFGFGFPPRLFGIKKGSTTYSINWIPLGGFVRILGEDGNHRDNPRSFASKSITRRFLVLVAGVTMNVILAWILLSINNVIGVPTAISPEEARTVESKIQITAVAPNSPAENGGVKTGEVIVSVNEKKPISTQEIIETINQNQGKEITMEIEHGEIRRNITLVPRENPPENEGAIGIGLIDTTLVKHVWYLAPLYGARDTFSLLWRIIVGFASLLQNVVTRNESVSGSVTGPLGIAALTKQVSEMGLQYLIQFTALLSVNLAVINILPLPALDGGRILFLVIEKIKGSPVKREREGLVHTIGFISLLGLMAIVTLFDIIKFKESIIGIVKQLF